MLTARAARGVPPRAEHLPSLALALCAAYATLLEEWLTRTDDPTPVDHHLADRLLTVLVDPHLTRHPTTAPAGGRPDVAELVARVDRGEPRSVD